MSSSNSCLYVFFYCPMGTENWINITNVKYKHKKYLIYLIFTVHYCYVNDYHDHSHEYTC